MAFFKDLAHSRQAMWNSLGVTAAVAVAIETTPISHQLGVSYNTVAMVAGGIFMGSGAMVCEVVARLVNERKHERHLARSQGALRRGISELQVKLQRGAAASTAVAPDKVLVSETLGTVSGKDLALCHSYAAYERFIAMSFPSAQALEPGLTYSDWADRNPFVR